MAIRIIKASLVTATAVLLFLAAGYVFTESSNYVLEPKVLARFKDIAKTEDVAMVSHSNNHFLFGHPHSVKYQLIVKGKIHQGECDLAAFSVLRCWFEGGQYGRLD